MFKWIKDALMPQNTRSFMKQSLEASVVRACANCGTKGVDDKGIEVGPVCPKCGEIRPTKEDLGVIWEKYR